MQEKHRLKRLHLKQQQLFNDFSKPEIPPTPPEVLSSGSLTIWKAFQITFQGDGEKQEGGAVCSLF